MSSSARWWPVQYRIQPAEFFFPQEHFEQAGLYKWQGLYYVTGQQISPWVWLPDGQPCGRVMTLFHSRDFSRWPAAKTLAFVPDGYKPAAQGLGAEAHMPASVWNRGKILLGLYGQWHGAPRAEDRSVDLGFLISNDGLHFREPQPGFHFLRPGPKGAWDSRALLQGQGFEHIGEKTYIWYEISNLFAQTDEEARNQIGLATMRRDGFGFIAVKRPEAAASLVTVLGVWLQAPVFRLMPMVCRRRLSCCWNCWTKRGPNSRHIQGETPRYSNDLA